MTPRVTYEDNIILELQVENSARTGDTTIAGTTAPTFRDPACHRQAAPP